MKYTENNKSIYVWLPKNLLADLKQGLLELENQEKSPNLKIAPAAYLLNLVVYLPLKRRDAYPDGWIPICAKLNKNIKHFSKYMYFLVNAGLLMQYEKNYSTSSKTCKKYSLPPKYKAKPIQLFSVEGHQAFVENRERIIDDKMKEADLKAYHLTKWLEPERFTVDIKAAVSYINKTYKGSFLTQKRNCRIFVVESIKKQRWHYSREGKDNRLHSILTSLPKDLRSFVRFDQKKLVSIDIKNSQPFIFAAILNKMFLQPLTNKEKPQLSDVSNIEEGNIADKLLNVGIPPIMFDRFDQANIYRGLERFVDQVIQGTFYEVYGEILYRKNILTRNYSGVYFFVEFDGKSQRFKQNQYVSLRKAAKHLVMKTLFCSKKYNHFLIEVFKNYYPEVFRVMQFLKKDGDKSYFPLLLQNVEAHCVLDYCTKKIADKYSNIPLFTIHDSIVTTEDFGQVVESEFKLHLQNYFNLLPQLQIEYWSPELNIVA